MRKRKKEAKVWLPTRLASILLLLNACCQEAAATQRDYYASPPKLGPVRGLRLPGPVVAFLGLPYAAPPTGLLRFMPAGATVARLQQHSTSAGLLLPSGQRAWVRAHSQFGPECVRLSDWLEARGSETELQRRQQSEDCLNANVFVPVHEGLARPSGSLMGQQIKSNHPSQTNNYLNTNGKQNSVQDNQESLNQATKQPLWSILEPASETQLLPALVLLHSGLESPSNKANSFAYLQVARQMSSVVVTFNYRTGLLGFLPYVDEDSSLARSNHAIWDQLGLLHWLRNNLASFNADPNNVTILAIDNKAALLLQLLSVTPLAKGLFQRVVLVQDEAQASLQLSTLIRQAGEARNFRRRLSSTLSEIFHPQLANNHFKVFEFVQAANLSQLAHLENQLVHTRSESFLEMALEPSLDDKLLFPHLSALIRTSHFLRRQAKATDSGNWTLLRSEINYCVYLRHLYANTMPDSLGLVSTSTSKLTGRHKSTPTSFDKTTRPSSRLRRTLIAANFNHLYHLALLGELLDKRAKFETIHEEEDDDDTDQSNQRKSNSMREFEGAQLAKRSVSFERAGDELEHLAALVSSYDLMLGYFRAPEAFRASEDSLPTQPVEVSKNSNLMSNIVTNVTAFDNRYLQWIDWADLHFVSSFVNSERLDEFCNFSSPKPTSVRSSFAFIAQRSSVQSESLKKSNQSWLLDSINNDSFSSALKNFIKFGNPNELNVNTSADSEWPFYESLNRPLKHLFSPSQDEIMDLDRQVNVHLDLVPYLNGGLNAWRGHNNSSEQIHLLACLGELDVAINMSSRSSARTFMDEARSCIVTSNAKFKDQLRHYAAEDLEPLIKLNPNNKSASTITTRNLVNEPSLTQNRSNGSLTDTTELGVNETSLVEASISTVTSRSEQSQPGPTTGLQGFFARVYKSAWGNALAIVVGTGLMIFLLNIAIVLVITLRSAQSRRRVRRDSVEPAAFNQTNSLQPESGKRSTLKRSSETGSGTGLKPKHLKFDLSGTENLRLASDWDPHVVTKLTHPIEQQVELNQFTSLPTDEINLLDDSITYRNPSNEMNSQSLKPLIDCPIHQDEREFPLRQQLTCYQDFQHPNQPLSHWPCGANSSGLSSPFASQSQSQSFSHSQTHSTSMDICTRQPADMQPLCQSRHKPGCQASRSCATTGAQFMPPGPMASPGSSTTLSITPLGLESFATANNFNQHYLLVEPLNLVYHQHLPIMGLEDENGKVEQEDNQSGQKISFPPYSHQCLDDTEC